MARTTKTFIEITDDLTGEQVAEDQAVTVSLSYEGKDFKLDLSTDSAKKLDEALAPFLTRAKPQMKTRFPRSGVEKAQRNDLKKIREWAAKNGYEVAPRGVIKKEVLDAYDKAH